ncbi:S8 family serine peptidase [Bradyrhizobium diversitatis]|uniref:S8 family serine peptidase n=1 Tax=Bradyrhizobium diversitatis TaxID=2755406 RepID=A0ABS0NY09_9BRAD|nr:S8 family serine peptidase [Bradyrhizobium diversitatis]MBH5385895.1 S8 family serine peptidase [Bradyrhizobium diversitatis]
MAVRELSPKSSISLQIMEDIAPGGDVFAIVQPLAAPRRVVSGAAGADPEAAVIVEADEGTDIAPLLARAEAKQVADLGGGLYAAIVPVKKASIVYEHANVRFVEAQKQKRTMLEKALVDGMVGLPSSRKVAGRGDGVVVGIIDSGFDLSHPAFRDGNNKLRVDALLEQKFNGTTFSAREFSTAQLEAGWNTGGNRPGFDEDGHGTHVASIAAGSPFNAVSGVAPDARFVLVKTDFIRLAEATKWCFDKADGRPAVVNMSLGGHHGAHDGASAEERALDRLSGPGRIVVLAAGNERIDNIHVGARLAEGQTETATLDMSTEEGGITIVCWYGNKDRFDVSLVSPSGTVMAAPGMNREAKFNANGARVTIGRTAQTRHKSVEVLIDARIKSSTDLSDFKGWKLRVTCTKAEPGRFDAWITGNGRFRDGAFVESARTIGLPATATRVIAVASHVTKNAWRSDDGPQTAPAAVVGRSSRFSSRGPTRDGREKPEISAPGEMITAALAAGSEEAENSERAGTPTRTLTIEGTSMATPFVSGVIALMLERRHQLDPEGVVAALQATAVKDAHTGPTNWTPEYGHGKISAQALVNHVNQMAPSAVVVTAAGSLLADVGQAYARPAAAPQAKRVGSGGKKKTGVARKAKKKR